MHQERHRITMLPITFVIFRSVRTQRTILASSVTSFALDFVAFSVKGYNEKHRNKGI